MPRLRQTLIGAACLLLLAGTAIAGDSPRALWIEVNNAHEGKTTIAVTVDVMKALLEADTQDLHFNSGKGKKDLVTRAMIEDLLDGKRDVIDVEDTEENETAHLYLADLDIPDHEVKKDHVVLETYKDGKRDLRLSLGDFEIDKSSDEDGDQGFNLNWRKCLPFLTQAGGAVYINNERDRTVVWVYAE